MTSNITIVVLVVWCVYMVLGASVKEHNDIQHRPRDTRLARRTKNIFKRFGSATASTFETEAVGLNLQGNGNPVFVHTIQRQRKAFLGSQSGATFNEKMEQIYEMRQEKWSLQKDVVVRDSPCGKDKLQSSANAERFYENVIELYTREDDCIYRGVNQVLRDYITQCNSSLGSFALMLNVVLTKWTSLSKYREITYRGVGFDIDPYSVGTTFTWTGFTSSSNDKVAACSFANKALFIIDNSADSDWRPRGIKEYSAFKKEDEYLYPATAMFRVTRVEQGACEDSDIKRIYISLQRGNNNQIRTGALSAGGTQRGTLVLVVIAAVVGSFV